jgi:AraC-like DNA-binding protein
VSVDGQAASATIVGTFPMPVGTRFEWHAHADHQIAWSPEGVLVVLTEGRSSYVLPPSRALWIPAGAVHETRASGAAVLRSVYLEPRCCPIDWAVPTPVAVSPLLGELIHHLDDRGLEGEERSRAEAVLFDLLLPLRVATIDVCAPTDPRARDVSDALLADPADPRTLHEWGHAVGASSRTLARVFLSDTGVSFGRWRTLVRLQASLRYLAQQMPVSAVAPLVGYRTTSAYVAAFRAHTGVTPGRYFQPPARMSLPHGPASDIPVEDFGEPSLGAGRA